MSTRARVAILEKRRAAAAPVEILVFLEDPSGVVTRHDAAGNLLEKLTRAEYDRKYPDSIHVTPPDDDAE